MQIRVSHIFIGIGCALFCLYGQESAGQNSAVEEMRRELLPSAAIDDMVMPLGVCPSPWELTAPAAGTELTLMVSSPAAEALQWTRKETLEFDGSNIVRSETEIVGDLLPVALAKSGKTLLLGVLPVRHTSRNNLVTYDWTLSADESQDVATALLELGVGETLSLDVEMSMSLDGLTLTHPTSGSVKLLGCGEVTVGDKIHSIRAFETNLPTSAVNAANKARVFYYRWRVYVSDSLVWPIIIDEGTDAYGVVTEIN